MVSGALFLLIPVALIIVLCSAYFLRVYLARHRAQIERHARHTEQNSQGEQVVEDDIIRMSNLHSPTASRLGNHRLHHISRSHGEAVYYMHNPLAEGIPGFVLAGNTSETLDQSVTAQYPEAVPVFGNREEAHAYRQRLREYQREQREERRLARREHRRRQRELQRMGHSSSSRHNGIRMGSSTTPPYSGATTPQGVSRSQSRTDHPIFRTSGELPLPEYRPDDELDEEEEEDDGYRSCTSSSSSSSDVTNTSMTTDYVSTADHSRSVSQAGVSAEVSLLMHLGGGETGPHTIAVPSSSVTLPVPANSTVSNPTTTRTSKRSKRYNYGRGWYIKPVSSTSNSGLRGPNDDGIVMGSMTTPLPDTYMDRSVGRLVDLSLGAKSMSSREASTAALDFGLLREEDNATTFYSSPLQPNPSSPRLAQQDTMYPVDDPDSPLPATLLDPETGRPVSAFATASPPDFLSPHGPATTAPVTPRSTFASPTSPNRLRAFPTSETMAGVGSHPQSREHSQMLVDGIDHTQGMSLPQYPETPETAPANPENHSNNDAPTASEMSDTKSGGWSSFFQTLSNQARQERKEQRRQRKEEAKRKREEEERLRLAFGNDAPPAVLMGWKESGTPKGVGDDTDPLSEMGSSTTSNPKDPVIAAAQNEMLSDMKPLPSPEPQLPPQHVQPPRPSTMLEKEIVHGQDNSQGGPPSSAGAPPSVAQTARQNTEGGPSNASEVQKIVSERPSHADGLPDEPGLEEEAEALLGNNVYRLYGVSAEPHRSPRPTMSSSKFMEGIAEGQHAEDEVSGLQLPNLSTFRENSGTHEATSQLHSPTVRASNPHPAHSIRHQMINHQCPNLGKPPSNNSMSNGPTNNPTTSYSSMTNMHHRPLAVLPEERPNTTPVKSSPPAQVSLGKRVMVIRNTGSGRASKDSSSAPNSTRDRSEAQNPLVGSSGRSTPTDMATKKGKPVSREVSPRRSSFNSRSSVGQKEHQAVSPTAKRPSASMDPLRRPQIMSSSAGIPIPIFSPRSSSSSIEDELGKAPFGDPASTPGDRPSHSPILYSLDA